MKPIVFVGFPCAGKTTAAKIMATQRQLQFVDLDTAVEEHYHTTIPHLLQKYGEFAFRRCEQAMLRKLLSCSDTVIATGGGAPCFEDNMQHINANAISIYLDISEETLVNRLENAYFKRPLAPQNDKEALKKYVHDTLLQRRHFYEQAHIILSENQLQDKKNLPEFFKNLHIPL